MRDGLFQLRFLSRHLAQNVFGARISRINLKLFLEFFFCVLYSSGIRLRLRKQQSPQQVVQARSFGVFRDHVFVFALCLVPFALHFQRLSVEFVGWNGIGRRAAQVLGGSSRKIRISVDQNKQNLGILGELMAQQTEKIQRRVATLHGHRAAYPCDARFFTVFYRPWTCQNSFEGWKRFHTAPLRGKRDRPFFGESGRTSDSWLWFAFLSNEGENKEPRADGEEVDGGSVRNPDHFARE